MSKILNIKVLVGLVALFCILSGCEDNVINPSDMPNGEHYYPVSIGNYWVYRVDSTLVLGTGNYKESTSYIREELESSFVNPNGDTSYIIQRSASRTQAGPYNFTDRWTLEKTNTELVRFEENLQFLKMIFPINVGDMWDGNRFDQKTKVFVGQEEVEVYLEWDYATLSDNDAHTINNIEYEDVLEIQQANYETDTETRVSTEYYAPNVGMIYRKMEIFDTQCFTPCESQPWIEKANKGFTMTQTLVEHN